MKLLPSVLLSALLAFPAQSFAASSASASLGPTTKTLLQLLAPRRTVKKKPVVKKILKPRTSSSKAPAGAYLDFNPTIIGNGRTSVLFFKASWCSTCKMSEGDLRNLYNTAPPPLTVYRVDYDTNLLYRKKYRVSYQHTFVKIDGQGNFVTALLRPDLEQLKKFLAK